MKKILGSIKIKLGVIGSGLYFYRVELVTILYLFLLILLSPGANASVKSQINYIKYCGIPDGNHPVYNETSTEKCKDYLKYGIFK